MDFFRSLFDLKTSKKSQEFDIWSELNQAGMQIGLQKNEINRIKTSGVGLSQKSISRTALSCSLLR